MNRLVSLALILSTPLSCLAFIQAGGEEIKFSSKSAYVLVPILATDSKGSPIFDLKQEDFTLLADKAAQPIASFEGPVKPSLKRMNHPPSAMLPTEFSNIGEEASAARYHHRFGSAEHAAG